MDEYEERPETEEDRIGEENSGQDEERRRLNEDAREFQEKFPEVNLWELEQDGRFRRFCGSRLYKESAAELYGAYLEFCREAEENAAHRENSRRSRSTGSGKAAGGLSHSQKRELEEWNRAFPGMKMTAGEFKAR